MLVWGSISKGWHKPFGDKGSFCKGDWVGQSNKPLCLQQESLYESVKGLAVFYINASKESAPEGLDVL